MTKVQTQPMTALAEPTQEQMKAWADEAQACVDSGEVIIADHEKARATIMALREHASLKARIQVLESALREISSTPDEDNEWDGVEKFHDVRAVATAALNPEQANG